MRVPRCRGTIVAKLKSTPVLPGMGTNPRGTMDRTCLVQGCCAPAASRYAAYCPPHRTALRRHGAVDQKAITKAQLKPYLKLVRKRFEKNPENVAWVTLD